MNRRNPTRIELKLEDLKEFEPIKELIEEGRAAARDVAVNTDPTTSASTSSAGNTGPIAPTGKALPSAVRGTSST